MLHEETCLKNTDQVSPGELMVQTLQDSPGEMTVHAPQSFYTTNQYFDDVSINAIESFAGIPDYLVETIKSYPTVLNTSGRLICIDGWNLIEEARREQRETIRCLIDVAENCPEEEIALRKVATRIIPLNGKCSYLETVRNIKTLYKMLMETRENLVLFDHGGRRRGNEFVNNNEENVRLVLATRLGKSPNTISKYLNHGEYLSKEAISVLMTFTSDPHVKPNKQFFEAAQGNKNKMLMELKSSGKSENEIDENLSGYVLQMMAEYRRKGTIDNYANARNQVSQDDQAPEPSTENAQTDTVNAKFLPKYFSCYQGNRSFTEDTSIDVNELKKDLSTVAENLIDASRNECFQIDIIISRITVCIAALSDCLQKCKTIDLSNQEQEGGNTTWVN